MKELSAWFDRHADPKDGLLVTHCYGDVSSITARAILSAKLLTLIRGRRRLVVAVDGIRSGVRERRLEQGDTAAARDGVRPRPGAAVHVRDRGGNRRDCGCCAVHGCAREAQGCFPCKVLRPGGWRVRSVRRRRAVGAALPRRRDPRQRGRRRRRRILRL